MGARQPFFVTGGTVRPDSPSYIERASDCQLLEALRQGEYCYVLDSRQKGKSSLMARTIRSLSTQGFVCTKLDLQRFGSNLDPEKWYASLLGAIGNDLGVSEEMFAYWAKNSSVGPLRRFIGGIEDVALANVQLEGKDLVVFVDEIDFVRSLPFSVDEFFAGVRELYNRRVEDPRYRRITFCLLGVAIPSELIRDVRITPFNIGRRIELTDFTLRECLPLAKGLKEHGEALIRRVHYWTNGHPYLTQLLCQALAERPQSTTAKSVDKVVASLFFSTRAREDEPNFRDIERRILEAESPDRESHLAGVLDLYRQVRTPGSRIRDSDKNPLAEVLKLSGLLTVVDGCLRVRNRIYYGVFDNRWTNSNLPDAEFRRQRAAARRATLRTSAVAALIIAAMGALAWNSSRLATGLELALVESRRQALRADSRTQEARGAFVVARNEAAIRAQAEAKAIRRAGELRVALSAAEAARKEANASSMRASISARQASLALKSSKIATQLALESALREMAAKNRADAATLSERGLRHEAERLLYVANMNIVQAEVEAANYRRASELLAEVKSRSAEFIGPEWGYWDCRLNSELVELRGHAGPLTAIAYSQDGRRVATGSKDGTARLWDPRTGEQIRVLKGHLGGVSDIAFEPGGTRIATSGSDGNILVWDLASGEIAMRIEGGGGRIARIAISRDGSLIAAACEDSKARVWSLSIGKQLLTLVGHKSAVSDVQFSPSGTLLATASPDATYRLWDRLSGREIASYNDYQQSKDYARVAFSEDGKDIATTWEWRARLHRIDKSSGPLTVTSAPRDIVTSIVLSPDSHKLVAGSLDGSIRTYYTKRLTEGEDENLRFERGMPHYEYTLATIGSPSTTARPGTEILRFEGSLGAVYDIDISPDGSYIASACEDGTARIWSFSKESYRRQLAGSKSIATSVTFSPDNSKILTSSQDGSARIFEVRSGQEVLLLSGHKDEVLGACFSPDGRRVATTSYDGTTRVWDSQTGRQLSVLATGGQSACFLKDGNHLLILAARTRAFNAALESTLQPKASTPVSLWDIRTSKLVWKVEGDDFTSIAVSSSGHHIAAGTSKGAIHLLRASDGKLLFVLNSKSGQGNYIWDLAFSRDGLLLAAPSSDRAAHVWSLKTKQEVCVTARHSGLVQSVAFTSDGSRLVTGCWDNCEYMWDIPTGRLLLRIETHSQTDTDIALSSDGMYLGTSSWDSFVHLVPLKRMWRGRQAN